jgi:hypothetical protein
VELVKKEGDLLVYQMEPREKMFLLGMLQLYPLNTSAAVLSKSAPISEEDQRLLDDSLKSSRQENRKQIDTLLNNCRWLKEHEEGYRLTLPQGEALWLLEILNDLRVGCWNILGRPDPHHKPAAISATNSSYFATMQISGYFQLQLLKGLEQDQILPPGLSNPSIS